MTLADHVRTLGRGPGRSRSLTQQEASDAMKYMLGVKGAKAAPEAIGALLMLLRMKGETASEIAGFAAAAQSVVGPMPSVDLDWPCYAAGRTRGAPWFLHAARQVADAGNRVLLHGWNGPDQKVRDGLSQLGIRVATTPDQVEHALVKNGIAYAPLEHLAPSLFKLLSLREVLGLRSCINTVCRMLNPAGAPSSVQGVFHPSYRLLQSDAARLLGWSNLTVIKGGGGEFERHPGKDVAAFGLRNGADWEGVLPALIDDKRKLSGDGADCADRSFALGPKDEFSAAVVSGTADAAFATLSAVERQLPRGALASDKARTAA